MGIQKIKLDYFLRKSKVGLNAFCEKNNLKNYHELVEYCLLKNFIAVTKEEYEKVFPLESKVLKEEEEIIEVVKIESPKPEKKTKKRRSRKKSSNSENWNSN